MAFYVEVLRGKPELTISLAQRLVASNQPDQVQFGSELLAHAGTPDRAAALSLVARRFQLSAHDQQALADLPILSYTSLVADSGESLDILWAAYFGSGDYRLLNQIVDAMNVLPSDPTETARRLRQLGASKPQPGSQPYAEAVALAVGESARRALSEVAGGSPSASADLRRIAAVRTDRAGAILQGLLAEAPR
jgi:hypothetical protein